MTQIRGLKAAASALALTGAWAAPAAYAQEASEADIDALVDGSSSPSKAITTARGQAQAGDLTGAAATLERALLADPNANDVRVFYTGLLCQLDDAQGARVELGKLNGQKFDEQIWADANRACGGGLTRPEAPASGGRTGLSGEIFVGVGFDSDAVGPLAVQFNSPILPVATDSGFAVIAGARISGKGSNYYSGGDAYGSAAIRTKKSFEGPRQNYDTVELRAGFGRQSGSSDFAVGGVMRHARLFNSEYVSEYGGQVELGVAHTANSRIALRGEAVYQDYASIGPGNAGQGWRMDFSASFEKQLGEDSFLVIGAGAELKDAKVKDNGYTGVRVFAAYRTPVGNNGHYFNLSTTLRHIDFKDNPPVLDRKDTRVFARAGYGIPLTDTGLTLEGALSYTVRSVKNRATVTPAPAFVGGLADYDSLGAEIRLSWKF